MIQADPSNRANDNWRVSLGETWHVLGPFPIHAREQHYLSPSFPLDLSQPVDLSRTWPSSLADGGNVSWTTICAQPDGFLDVSFPNIRWKSLRATEGWAALQHHALLYGTLILFPPRSGVATIPHLRVNLIQGSFFTVLPKNRTDDPPQWFSGNIYMMERALPQTVNLPSPPSITEPTCYDIFISGDYEIRLFGDPAVHGSSVPVQKLRFIVEAEDPMYFEPVTHEPSQDVLCDFVQGYAFGATVGVGVRSISGWWTVVDVVAMNTDALSLSLEPENVTLAQSQTRIVPIILRQNGPFNSSELQVQFSLRAQDIKRSSRTLLLSLPIKQLTPWSPSTYCPIMATYLGSSVPTPFIVIPPRRQSSQNPILALHGAGVDILGQPFWARALPRRQDSWTILPSGRTSWGLDWHGPSALDAWASVSALSSIVSGNEEWKNFSFHSDSRVLIMGHSNGGQGALYLASRYPDKVVGVVSAAGYIKSQAYVPLTMSRSGHYIDPAMRSILESSLTPDDNDLHLSNLTSMPVLIVHGENDDNVPVWHSREVVSILKFIKPDANVRLKEDVGQGHWYPDVLNNEEVNQFVETTLSNSVPTRPREFTLTVSNPAESGSLHGWKIEKLFLPGRLARLHVRINDDSNVSVSTSNVLSFSLDRRHYECHGIQIDNCSTVPLTSLVTQTILFRTPSRSTWEVTSEEDSALGPPSRMQAILTSPSVLVCIVPDASLHREMDLASRIAHDLLLYHRLDACIISESYALSVLGTADFPLGNVIYIGHPSSAFARLILEERKTLFETRNSLLTLHGHLLSDPNLAAIFLHPHPKKSHKAVMLFLLGNSSSALERAVRFFPIRTGIALPSWVVTSHFSDGFGAAGIHGAGIWTDKWGWNEATSMWLF